MLKIPRSVILKNKFVSSNDEDQQVFRNGEVFSSLNIYIYIYIYIIRLTSLKIDKGEKTSHGEFKLEIFKLKTFLLTQNLPLIPSGKKGRKQNSI